MFRLSFLYCFSYTFVFYYVIFFVLMDLYRSMIANLIFIGLLEVQLARIDLSVLSAVLVKKFS